MTLAHTSYLIYYFFNFSILEPIQWFHHYSPYSDDQQLRTLYISFIGLLPIFLVLVIAFFRSERFNEHFRWGITFVILTICLLAFKDFLVFGIILIVILHIIVNLKRFMGWERKIIKEH
jgi:hypothetical protein